MAQRKITVIQHNVLQWYNKCISLSNTYKILEPDIIFINSHCMPEDTTMKIPGYNIHKKKRKYTQHSCRLFSNSC